MTKRIFAVLFLSSCVQVFAASDVEIAVEELKAQRNAGSGIWITILSGAGTAYGMANAQLKYQGLTPLFCQPAQFILNPLNFADIVLGEFREEPKVYNLSQYQQYPMDVLTLALLRGLRKSFPCK